jgi:hypothetical protein
MRLFLTTFVVLVALVGCAGDEHPTVMRLVGSSPGISEVTGWSLDGSRDGARTRATATFDLAGGRQLEVRLLLAYDPRPVLAEGTWKLDGESGRVHAESVRFVGGQGEGPSVGGDYVLVDDRNLPRYRVQIPLTPIAVPTPRP